MKDEIHIRLRLRDVVGEGNLVNHNVVLEIVTIFWQTVELHKGHAEGGKCVLEVLVRPVVRRNPILQLDETVFLEHEISSFFVDGTADSENLELFSMFEKKWSCELRGDSSVGRQCGLILGIGEKDLVDFNANLKGHIHETEGLFDA